MTAGERNFNGNNQTQNFSAENNDLLGSSVADEFEDENIDHIVASSGFNDLHEAASNCLSPAKSKDSQFLGDEFEGCEADEQCDPNNQQYDANLASSIATLASASLRMLRSLRLALPTVAQTSSTIMTLAWTSIGW